VPRVAVLDELALPVDRRGRRTAAGDSPAELVFGEIGEMAGGQCQQVGGPAFVLSKAVPPAVVRRGYSRWPSKTDRSATVICLLWRSRLDVKVWAT
jgi:hypothetical protein